MTIDEMKKTDDVPVVIVNREGNITYVNQKFEEKFGFNEGESLGNHITMIIPEELHDAHNMGFSKFLETEKPTLLNQPLNLKALHKSGKTFDAEHYIVAEKNGQEWAIGATIEFLEE